MYQKYQRMIFKRDSLEMIDHINVIIEEYRREYRLTVRQLYYQLVARGIIPNNMLSYKRITKLVNNARLAGLIDWDMIEDRTRSFKGRGRWDSASQILRSAADGFHMDMWEDQESRCFAIVEKEALFGVLERVCNRYDVPLLAAKGYPSSSVLRDFVINNVLPYSAQHIHLIHLGDHDPSGIDMTRDLKERIGMFCEARVPELSLTRIALNMDQVEEKRPPPNPAKMTDSRVGGYIRQYGNQSWELDALEPRYLETIVTEDVTQYIDEDRWAKRGEYIEEQRARIALVADNFDNEDDA